MQMERPSPSEVMNHLENICSSEAFARSPQGKKVLRYLVDAGLRRGDSGSFKGMLIGIEVFGLSPAHDPSRQSIVRVTVATLRDRLAKYYETEGRDQPVRIRIPPRSYVPDIAYDADFAASALDATSAMYVANAKALMNRVLTPSGHHEALRYLGMALERQPEHPRLLSLMAMAHVARAAYGVHARTACEAARGYAVRARQQGRETWELPMVEAWLAMKLDFDWPKADRLFDRAIELNATEARHHTWHTTFLASQLRWQEFLSLVEEDVTGPAFNSAYSRGRLAFAQIVAGRLDAAEETLRQSFELFPNAHYTNLLHLGLLREAQGDFERAAGAFEQVTVPAEDTTLGLGFRALAHGLAGDKSTARRLHSELLAMRNSKECFVPAARLGYACVGTGDLDRAIQWFTEAYIGECDVMSSWAAILPTTRHLWGEQAFTSLVRDRLKLRFNADVSHELTLPSNA